MSAKRLLERIPQPEGYLHEMEIKEWAVDNGWSKDEHVQAYRQFYSIVTEELRDVEASVPEGVWKKALEVS